VAGGVFVFPIECMMVFGEHPIPLGVGLRGPMRHRSFQGKAVDNAPVSMTPCQGKEPLTPLAHSLKTCKAPESDSQNRHGDHQRSDTELQNAHGPISEGFRLILLPRARFAKILCGEALAGVIPHGLYVRAAKPVRRPAASMPEPDRCVVRGTIREYTRRSPGPGDVALIVEVADSSLSEDRMQALLYARGGIPIDWIVNLVDRQVEVYSNPRSDGYATPDIYRPGQHVPLIVDGTIVGQIAVDDILP
jgi:Putative restriction endonuclease